MNHEEVHQQHQPYPSHQTPLRPPVQSSSTAAWETGSKQQLESNKDVYSHPTLFNLFLKRIMTGALEDHKGTVSIVGRTITNLCFADDIECSVGEGEELAKLVEQLDKAFTAYGMEISAKKTKLMTNSTSRINREIKVNRQSQASSTWAQLCMMRVPSLRYFPGWHRQQQHGKTGAFLSVPRYNCHAPLLHASSCKLLNHGPSQQICKEENETLKCKY